MEKNKTKLKSENAMTGYKGFDKNLKCKDFQYEIGKTYKLDGKPKLCEKGFHFCENPLDTFQYYPPTDSRYAVTEAQEVSEEQENDSKRVSKILHVSAELTLNSLIGAGVKFILDKVNFKNSPATNTGYKSAASVEGKESVAMVIGIESKAKGALGCWIVLAEWKRNHLKEVRAARVDGKKIKANVWYRLVGRKFKEIGGDE